MSGIKVYIVSVFLILTVPRISSQPVAPSQNAGREYLTGVYLEKTGPERAFIDGRNYYPYHINARNSPLLRNDEPRSARLTINGRSYDNLDLSYDTYTDDLIYTDDSLIYDNRVRQVALNKHKISRFDLFFRDDTLCFRYLNREADSAFNLAEGYFEVALEGKVTYLIRHRSIATRVAPAFSAGSIWDYVYKPEHYIRTGNDFVRITSRRQFTGLFGEHSHDMNRYLQSRRIKVSRADKEQIIDVLRYFGEKK